MPERSIRFGVLDAASQRRAATWKIFTSQKADDVYLVCRPVGNAIKLSLHESGRWHFGFSSIDLFDEDAIPESRFLGVYEKPLPLVSGLTLACRVQTPWFASTIPFDPSEQPATAWLAPAPDGHSVEVAIFLFADAPPPAGDWPGRDSMGTTLVGQLQLAGGGGVVAVQYLVPFVNLLPEQPTQPKYFKGFTPGDMKGAGMRALGWGQNTSDGSIVVMEAPVLVG